MVTFDVVTMIENREDVQSNKILLVFVNSLPDSVVILALTVTVDVFSAVTTVVTAIVVKLVLVSSNAASYDETTTQKEEAFY